MGFSSFPTVEGLGPIDLDTVYMLKSRVLDYLQTATYRELALVVVGFWFVTSFLTKKGSPKVPGAPYHGYRSIFEPTLWLQLRFVTGGYNIIESGYNKLKNVPFVIRRYDTDITVLPIKYLEEMRLVPRSKLSAKKAQINNLVPKWTWTAVMMNSDLHVHVLNAKLNPELSKYVEIAHTELDYGWDIDVPKPNTWTETDIQQSMRMLVARMSAKIFMGDLACRNEEWLNISIEFTYDLFKAAFTLRMFPPWMHLFVAPLIPARWRIRRQMRVARKIVGDITRKHLKDEKEGVKGQDTLLNWMIDHGTEQERSIPEMGARQCIMTLASIHTTSMSVSNLLFDLCTHPQWFPVLREEVDDVIKTHGALGESKLNAKQWLAKLEKMDSLIVECQRINPPILLNPQRLSLVPITLKDGTHIPKGARIAWAGHHHANDPATLADPELFDPMRSYRKRHADNGANMNKYIAGQTDSSTLSFGYGGQSCPGRYFAVAEIKMMLMRMLLEFEFKLPEGKERPKIMYADENVFMDPHATLMVRARKKTPSSA